MATATISKAALKAAMKEALVETLQKNPELFRGVFADVLEDFALVNAIREGRQSPRVSRAAVVKALRNDR